MKIIKDQPMFIKEGGLKMFWWIAAALVWLVSAV